MVEGERLVRKEQKEKKKVRVFPNDSHREAQKRKSEKCLKGAIVIDLCLARGAG